MVHTTSAVAFAVLALNAASTLALPVESQSDIAQREFEDFNIEVRDLDFDLDTREYDDYDVEAREPEDYEVDARDYDFGEYEERNFFNSPAEEIVERAPTATAPSSTDPSTTITTIVAQPTGTAKGKPTKTVVITIHKAAKGCKKPSVLDRLRNTLKSNKAPLAGSLTPTRKQALVKHLKYEEKKANKNSLNAAKASASASATSASATPSASLSSSSSSSSTSGSQTSTASVTPSSSVTATSANATATGSSSATSTSSADWSAITAPPVPKGFKVTETKKVGRNKVTTITRVVTAAPTPCAARSSKVKRDLEDIEEVLERVYFSEFDELD